MKRAENVAIAWVNTLYKDLVNPGEFRGPKFDAKTFEIEDFVEAMLPMSYPGRVSAANIKLARETARKEWDNKTKEC